MTEQDLVIHLARFARALRERGVRVGLSDEVDGVSALTLVDMSDRSEVRRALRVALKIRRRDWDVFHELFSRCWTSEGVAVSVTGRSARAMADSGSPARRLSRGPEVKPGERASGAGATDAGLPGYSPEVLLRRKPFDECSSSDLDAMERLLARLAVKLATCKSRRLSPTRGRGTADIRRSFRRAIAASGEFLSLARRARAVEEPRLVVLCDTSGSMDPHTRFLLAFVLSLKRVARRTEIFAFNTALTRLTPWLSPTKITSTLDRVATGVPDWSGGTKIGECLAQFVEQYLNELVNAKTMVVIFSDGLDRGETTPLVRAMRAIRSRARKVIWLNPLLGDPRYRPTARGMEVALPFVDHFLPAHNLESLEGLLQHLAA